LTYGSVGTVVFLLEGPKFAIGVSLALPVLGWALVAWLHRVRSILRLSRITAATLVVGRGIFDRLGAERAELREELDGLITTHVPDDMDRLFEPVAER
jgi:hypothetical protein